MRVVHVAPCSFGASGIFGGGERYPLELARALAAHVATTLVVFGGTPGRRVEGSGLTVCSLRPLFHLHGHPANPVARGLGRAFRGADLVHAHHLRSAPSKAAAVVARAAGRPVVVTDHGYEGSTWGGLLPRLFDLFLTVSEYSARELALPPERTRVVFGGADPDRYRPDPRLDRRGVLYVGRLTPHKGVDRLIAALPAGAPLSIVGSGGHDPSPPEREYPELLRRLARDRDVAFLGPVGDEELAKLYRRAEVLVVPSVHETCYGRYVRVPELLGLSALEAMASGTPVVASRVGGLSEVVVDGETGFLVDPGDVEGLRDRLAQILGDRRLAAALGARARERVLERFTWSACAERCLAAYAELVPTAPEPTGARYAP